MPNLSDSSRQRRWAVVLPALCVPLVMSLLYFVLLPGTMLGNGLYVFMKVMLVLWPWIAMKLILKEPLSLALSNKRAGIIGLGTGAVIVLLMFGLMQTPIGDIVNAGAGNIQEKVAGMGVLDHFLWFALFLCVGHSLIEEVYWRGFVCKNLLKLIAPWKAHLIAGVGFSAHHIVVLSQFFPMSAAVALGACVGIGGILWSLLMVRQQSLLGPWMSHLVVDVGIMVIGAQLMGLL